MNLGKKLALIFGAVAVLGTASSPSIIYVAQPNEDITFDVIKTERITSQSGDQKYMVFTENSSNGNNVFEVSDTVTRFNFNSASTYGKIKDGCTYKATVFGYRSGFLSAQENIIDVEKISCNTSAPKDANRPTI